MLALALVVVLVACAGCERRSATGPPVVLIVLDTFRADHLGAIGGREDLTPNLDALAREGTLYTQCYAPYPLTLPSVSSILSSQWPLVHRVRENYDERPLRSRVDARRGVCRRGVRDRRLRLLVARAA